jgi:hypothetical protein
MRGLDFEGFDETDFEEFDGVREDALGELSVARVSDRGAVIAATGHR